MSGDRSMVSLVVVHGPASDPVVWALIDSGYVPMAIIASAVVWARWPARAPARTAPLPTAGGQLVVDRPLPQPTGATAPGAMPLSGAGCRPQHGAIGVGDQAPFDRRRPDGRPIIPAHGGGADVEC